MALDPKRLMELDIPDTRPVVDDRTAILYALSVGMGSNDSELPFVYEDGLRAVPSLATVLAYNDDWLESGGVDLSAVFHVAQHLRFLAPLPVSGPLVARNRIVGVVDKGPGKAALIVQQANLTRAGDSKPVVEAVSTLFVRGGGGFGGSVGMDVPAQGTIADRTPDETVTIATRHDQAMLFRLLGDRNPLHIDPVAAEKAGVGRPIMHGACTFGIACAEILRQACGLQPDRMAAIGARFIAPVYPGEQLAMQLWRSADAVAFRLRAPDRDATILDSGHAQLRSR